MIKYINKCFQMAFLILFTFIVPTHCSQQFWYSSINSEIIKQNPRGFVYGKSTVAIDMAIGLRSMIQRSYMKMDPERYIEGLKNKLILMEKNIRMAEEKEIYIIAQDNGLNGEQIKRLFQELKDLKISYKEFLNNPDHSGDHDVSIPKENIALIKETLSKAQLSANNIHLLNSSESMHLVAETIIDCDFRKTENNAQDVLYEHRFNELTMLFYPTLYLLDNTDQFGTCIHEARHVIEGHCLSNAFIKFFIRKHSLNNDIDCQKLVQIQERQAEILPSIQDKESALLMRAKRSDSYYQNMLYEKHYLQLSDIDETHKMIAYLENINAQSNA